MDLNHIQEIWDKGKEEPRMSKADIQRLLGKRVRKQLTTFRMSGIWLYAILPAATLVVGCLNILGYRANLTMLIVVSAMMVAAAGMLAFGIDVARRHERMQRQDADLVTTLRHQLHFYRNRYNAWLWMTSVALVLLSLNVNFVVDNQGGYYPFHLSVVFVVAIILQLSIAFGILKVAEYAHLRELKAILSDLELQVTEATDRFDTSFKPKARRWAIVAAILGTILLILGILAAMQY